MECDLSVSRNYEMNLQKSTHSKTAHIVRDAAKSLSSRLLTGADPVNP